MLILGQKLKIELKFDFGARIGFFMVPLVLGVDFSARMYFVIICECSGSVLVFQVPQVSLVDIYRIPGLRDLR